MYAEEVNSLVSNCRDEVLEQLTDEASVCRNLRKYRSGLTPPNPGNLAELLIPDDPRWHCTSDGQRFLLHDNGADAAERVIVWATDEGLEVLAAADHIFADGTFGTAPDLMNQAIIPKEV